MLIAPIQLKKCREPKGIALMMVLKQTKEAKISMIAHR